MFEERKYDIPSTLQSKNPRAGVKESMPASWNFCKLRLMNRDKLPVFFPPKKAFKNLPQPKGKTLRICIMPIYQAFINLLG